MFNFSANNIQIINRTLYDKCTVYNAKDLNTNRCYKVYDYTNSLLMEQGSLYCISGKVNSADKLYLVLENAKPQISANIQLSKSKQQTGL